MPQSELTINDEQADVIRWRKQWLVSAGFSMRNAELLACNNRVDYRFAMKTLENAKRKGHDEDFVMKLIT